MNEELKTQIIHFMNTVGWYIMLEYGFEYNLCWHDKDILNNTIYPLIAKYYMGGNTVPETAYQVVCKVKTIA
jgi:hypothetical protein